MSKGWKKSEPGKIKRFAAIPVDEVLKAEAVTTLNHAAFRVLVIIAGQCWYRARPAEKNKGRNGTAALTEVHAANFGFVGRDTLYRSLKELTKRGLIVVTREGLRVKNSFTLYAVGWLPVTHLDGKPIDPHIAATSVPLPRCLRRFGCIPDFREWKASTSIPKSGSDAAEIVTDSRECTVPAIGSVESKYVPIIGSSDPKSLPKNGNTSRYLGEAGSVRSSVSAQTRTLPVSKGDVL